MEYDSVKDAYAAGGSVAGDINNILAKEFCADLVAPVKARILGQWVDGACLKQDLQDSRIYRIGGREGWKVERFIV